MELYDIRLCKKDELSELQDFIRNYWRKNHILAGSKEIFEFQHTRAEDGFYHFIIAKNKETKNIDGIFGFILSDTYDKSKQVVQTKWGIMLKVNTDIKNDEVPLLGLAMFEYFINQVFPNAIYAALGLSNDGLLFYRLLKKTYGLNLGIVNHYYIANNNIRNFRIAENPVLKDLKDNPNVELKELNIMSVNDFENTINPYKNIEYYKNRYLYHPVFKYIFVGVYHKNGLKLIFVIRKVEHDGSFALRLVDFIGSVEDIGSIYCKIQKLLEEHNAEYIDCYNFGIDSKYFLDLGFNIVDDEKNDVIIPNHFTPYKRENVKLDYVYMGEKPVVIFYGDTQDRPNFVN